MEPELTVHHIAVKTRDLPRTERFYTTVLGRPVVKRWFHGDGSPRSVWVGLGGQAFIAIEHAEADEDETDESAVGWHMVALRITAQSREIWRARLQAAKVTIAKETDYTLYFRDPDGTLIGLSHYPDPAP